MFTLWGSVSSTGGSMRHRRLMAVASGVVLAMTAAGAAGAGTLDNTPRDVLVVGNSQAGTVSFVDGHTFANLGSFNVVPDLNTRLAEIYLNPVWLAGYQAVRAVEGGDRFVDDATLSPDGRTLYVSRGNLDDVAAFDIASHTELWHT